MGFGIYMKEHPLLTAWLAFESASKQGRSASFHWENGAFVAPLVVCDAPKRTRKVCGAKTRAGTPCKATVCLRPDGSAAKRCRLHGGLSSGPKTKEGREAIGAANRTRVKSRNSVLSSG